MEISVWSNVRHLGLSSRSLSYQRLAINTRIETDSTDLRVHFTPLLWSEYSLYFGKCTPFIGIVAVIYHSLCSVKGWVVNTRVIYGHMDRFHEDTVWWQSYIWLQASSPAASCFLFIMVHNEKLGHSFGKVI